jgi:phospholipase C
MIVERNDAEHDRLTRRHFLGAAAALAAGVTGSLSSEGIAGAQGIRRTGPLLIGRAKRTSPIKTIVVSCQENHSFDNYLGMYSRLPPGYGIPKTWENSGISPFHLTSLTGNGDDPNHDWTSTHEAYAGGKMTGFVSNGNGREAMGYYTSEDLPYYYALAEKYTLCAGYHCGVLTETLPNRMVLYAGTSGGITGDTAPRNGSLRWPNIITLLEDAGITYANYNFHCPSDYSFLALWQNAYRAPRMNQSMAAFFAACKNGRLPQVVFIEKQTPWDEHPPANIQTGEGMMEQIVTAIEASPQWEHTAILHTYDEGGGYFDHRAPIRLDTFGSGIRVPMIVASPLAKKGHVDTTYSDHGSVLKFIEHVFGLHTLASINHEFDKGTPIGAGLGRGAPFRPRDGNARISNLAQCFTVDV